MCDCYAVLSKDDPRYSLWVQVDPKAHIPLKHPVPHKNPNNPEMTFYEGDPSRLTERQKDVLVELMHEKFKVPKAHVREGLSKGVLPVRSDNVSVVICSLHVRCMM